MEDASGQPLSLGSGFFVRDGEVGSNLHVVEGAASGYAKVVGQKAKREIDGVTAIDPEQNLVVLNISGARASVLALGSSDAVRVGEAVCAVGNPQGLEGTFSQGIAMLAERPEIERALEAVRGGVPASRSTAPLVRTREANGDFGTNRRIARARALISTSTTCCARRCGIPRTPSRNRSARFQRRSFRSWTSTKWPQASSRPFSRAGRAETCSTRTTSCSEAASTRSGCGSCSWSTAR